MPEKKKLKLVLEDGSEYIGDSFGSFAETSGEVVFSTGMVGYPEAITDPSFKKQILVLTCPLIGNYGVPAKKKDKYGLLEGFESEKIQISGLIVSNYSEHYNHHQAVESLSSWMKNEGIPGLTGIDTRSLTKKIREKGVMAGKIVEVNKKVAQKEFENYNVQNLVSQVSISKPVHYSVPGAKKTVLMIDCGLKTNILRNILNRNVNIIRVPWDYNFLASSEKFDGIFLSNGPGDPALLKDIIERLTIAYKRHIPIVGICLGVQLLAHAIGGKTYKLKYGHRSQNQPCIDLETERCYLTTQNHGFNVDEKSLPKDFKVWFRNANDNTVEGIKHKTLPYAAVQFHPESYPGPTDAEYIFDKLLALI